MKTIVYGPPGTGKTTRLAREAEEADAKGEKILFLSFTKSAAHEATGRIKQKDAASTVHALAFRTLGYSKAQVMDTRKLKVFGEEIGIAISGSMDEAKGEGDDYLKILSFAKNALTEPQTAYMMMGEPGTPTGFQYFMESYDNFKKEYGYIDFDDMLLNFCGWLEQTDDEFPVIDRLIVDEAQDLTSLQWAIVNSLQERSRDVVVAGDDDQSIYTWMGADPHRLIALSKDRTWHKEILEQSHRVPIYVHRQALEIIHQINNRVEKEYKPRPAWGDWQRVGSVQDAMEFADEDTMVLFRDRYKMEDTGRLFQQEMIPYSVLGGWSPFTSRWAKKIKAGEDFDIFEVPMHLHHFYRALTPEVLEKPFLQLGTMHQSKGLEAKTVIVDLELQGKSWESWEFDPDSERRLLYVAVTRAKHNLILCGGGPIVS